MYKRRSPNPLAAAPGGDLVLSLPGCVRPKVKDMRVIVWLQQSEKSENISLKMGVKFAASLNMGKNLCLVLNIITYKNGENELQLT